MRPLEQLGRYVEQESGSSGTNEEKQGRGQRQNKAGGDGGVVSRGPERTTEATLALAPERIERRILWIRGQKVMLDADLAVLYGTTTKALNQAVKRNVDRFPGDFMFRLNRQEKHEVVTNCDHLRRLKYAPTLPYAFTEHGAVMLASILNSSVAVQASIQVVRAFIRLREILATHKELARKLAELEQKYDKQFKVVFDAIRELMTPPRKPMRPIGFRGGSES